MNWSVAVLVGAVLFPPPLLAAQGAAPPPWAPWVPWLYPSAAPSQPVAPPVSPSASPAVAPAAVPSGVPVVLELFTSVDCPACESAEYEVNRLATTQPVAGARILPLAFHVEFYGGTSNNDPYVLAAGTRRQSDYDAARGRVYTPQAIVDGDHEFIGSQDSTARSSVAAAARQPKITVEVARSPRFAAPGSLPVVIRYGRAPGGHRGLSVAVILTESNLVFERRRADGAEGERTPLAPVVRSIQEVGSASPGGGSAEATVSIPVTSARGNLTVVALLQESGTRHIVGAGTMPAGIF